MALVEYDLDLSGGLMEVKQFISVKCLGFVARVRHLENLKCQFPVRYFLSDFGGSRLYLD